MKLATKPTTPKKQQRKQPEPDLTLEQNTDGIGNKRLAAPDRNKDSVSQKPLKATPTDSMPPMPE